MKYFFKCNHATDTMACPVCYDEMERKLVETLEKLKNTAVSHQMSDKVRVEALAKVDAFNVKLNQCDDELRKLRVENEMLKGENERLSALVHKK